MLPWRLAILVWLCVGYFICDVRGYSDGAPSNACQSMTPQHSSRSTRGGGTPSGDYNITTSKDANGAIRVVISGKPFKGFLIKAVGRGKGYFESNYRNPCSGESPNSLPVDKNYFAAATHSNSDEKTRVDLIWHGEDNVDFDATVVIDFNSYERIAKKSPHNSDSQLPAQGRPSRPLPTQPQQSPFPTRSFSAQPPSRAQSPLLPTQPLLPTRPVLPSQPHNFNSGTPIFRNQVLNISPPRTSPVNRFQGSVRPQFETPVRPQFTHIPIPPPQNRFRITRGGSTGSVGSSQVPGPVLIPQNRFIASQEPARTSSVRIQRNPGTFNGFQNQFVPFFGSRGF